MKPQLVRTFSQQATLNMRAVTALRGRILFIVVLSLMATAYLLLSSHSATCLGAARAVPVAKERLQESPPMKRVLLVTYGRSGSTFTSYILKEAPEAFFFFEPLRPLLMRTTRGVDVIMNYTAIGGKHMTPQVLPHGKLTPYELKALGLLEFILDCNLSKFPVNDYQSKHFRTHGDVAEVANCLLNLNNNTSVNLAPYLRCLVNLNRRCDVSKLLIIKSIRLPLRALFGLLRKYPDLRVLYLVRDPRAILRSQAKAFGRSPKSGSFCRVVMDDVKHMQLLLQIFPGRVATVRYEDISKDPLEWTRRLYKFLRLEMTQRVVDNVRNLTSGPSEKNVWIYSVVRSDARRAANRWRTEVHLKDIREVDQACGNVYEWLGYKPASNASLHDPNTSLVTSHHKLPLL